MVEATTNHEGEHVEGYEVDEKDVSAPGGDHVEIRQWAESRPVDRAGFDGLDPEVVGEEHAENGDPFIVVRASHRPTDVAWHNGDLKDLRKKGSLKVLDNLSALRAMVIINKQTSEL